MRLNFSVLWFDDNEDWIDSLDTEELESEILSWGFTSDIDMVSTPEEFNSQSPFKTYDLIVIDRILEGYQEGQEFITNLRNHGIFTEIIFYTAGNVSDLWEAIQRSKLEGVFVSHRNDILSKIAKVGHQSIRKVLDLENMRGIVMAEVGELDHLLDEILNLGINNLPGEQQGHIFQRFYKKALENQVDCNERLEKFIEKPAVESMLLFCDSSKRWQNFNRLRKKHAKLNGNNNIGDYENEVLQPRNFLAHGRPLEGGDGSFSFLYKEKEYYFDNDVSLALRQTILKYKTDFSDIIDLLKEE